jgi:hypothetical protein
MSDNRTGREKKNVNMWYNEEIGNIQVAIAEFKSHNKSNIAIIAEPFAGKTAFIEEVDSKNLHKTTMLSLTAMVKHKDEITLPEQSRMIVIIDDCQFLYSRRIGGFDILMDFLNTVSAADHLFITTWNVYSWDYLEQVVTIGKYFPIQIRLPKFTPSTIKEYILSEYAPGEIEFKKDTEEKKEKIVNFTRYPVTIKPLKISFTINLLKINYSLLKSRLYRKEEIIAIEDIIFDKINHFSRGNPGLAKILWHKSLEYPVIKPSYIKDFSVNIDLDYDESFILGIILAMKVIWKEELNEIVGDEFQVDEIVYRLLEQGLISVDDGMCSINPEALPNIVEFLKKSRIVW